MDCIVLQSTKVNNNTACEVIIEWFRSKFHSLHSTRQRSAVVVVPFSKHSLQKTKSLLGRIRPSGESGGKEFNIEVLHILDREVSPHGYNLTLKAVDAGVPQRTYYKNVHVQG